ncbi:glucosaminidase domain-containing protein [Marinimicrobium sp. ARAG 43.8]|uniref:glucosaminidase domain-containing protein n=1 Tax=Marinimicrobium sp. ARAG 43.8 TaxID=3418719 RepID=UPI003CE92022
MKQGFTQWMLGLGLVAFPIGCLVLALYLAYHLPQPLEEVTEPEEPVVPRPAELTKLPEFDKIETVPDRKQRFFATLMPMVEWRNHQLTRLRGDIEAMITQLDAGETLSGRQEAELERLRIHFRVTEDNYPDTREALDVLMRRSDIIPPEMVLAQAAAESGWGTSRFAQEGNNLFGQWCYRRGCGLVPNSRPEGASHEVQKFSTVNEAVATYFRNINTNHAYREVRQIRAEQRALEEEPTGIAMVEGLHRYSSRGQAYIEELKELIRYNELENVHEVWLASNAASEEEDTEAISEVASDDQEE